MKDAYSSQRWRLRFSSSHLGSRPAKSYISLRFQLTTLCRTVPLNSDDYYTDETRNVYQTKVAASCPEAPFLEHTSNVKPNCLYIVQSLTSTQLRASVLIMICSHEAFPGIASAYCAGIAPFTATMSPIVALDGGGSVTRRQL